MSNFWDGSGHIYVMSQPNRLDLWNQGALWLAVLWHPFSSIHYPTNFFCPPTFFSLLRATPDFSLAMRTLCNNRSNTPYLWPDFWSCESPAINYLTILMQTYNTGSLLYPFYAKRLTVLWSVRDGSVNPIVATDLQSRWVMKIHFFITSSVKWKQSFAS